MLRCWAVALAAWMSLHVPSQARTQPWWHRGDSRRRGECSPLLAGIQLHDTLACTRVADDQSWMMPRRAGIRLSQVEGAVRGRLDRERCVRGFQSASLGHERVYELSAGTPLTLRSKILAFHADTDVSGSA